MAVNFKKIGVIGKPGSASESQEIVNQLLDILKQAHCQVYVEQELSAICQLTFEDSFSAKESLPALDLLIVVGGDGSMLSAARDAVSANIPVLGINRGHLGFLTDITPAELAEGIHNVLNGQYRKESRFLLTGEIIRNGKQIYKKDALNDIVLSLGSAAQLIEFEIWIDGDFVCKQRADGLIITTPTGSTAYALSAGGPILHPALAAIALVPMMPHKLTSRPIVVNAAGRIKIIMKNKNNTTPTLSFDSHDRFDLLPEDIFEVYRKQETLTLIHPASYDYFATLRDKLYWESR